MACKSRRPGQCTYLPMTQTWAPLAAKACAVASPMPAEPPAPGHFLVRPLVWMSGNYVMCAYRGRPAPVTSTLLPARSSYFPMTGVMALMFAGGVSRNKLNSSCAPTICSSGDGCFYDSVDVNSTLTKGHEVE